MKLETSGIRRNARGGSIHSNRPPSPESPSVGRRGAREDLRRLHEKSPGPLSVKDLTTKDIIDLIVQQRPAMIEG